ncbi:hypothetical protein N2152v2_009054 [Parachlorella kessleri]
MLGLGYGILAGSTLVKVPQLLNVVRARSADGLNPISFELETLGLLIATTYGFLMRLPFSAFGEVVALLLQNNLLLLLIYRYQHRSLARTFTFVTLLATWGAGDFWTAQQLFKAYSLLNFGSRSTGQLSIITYFLNFAGASARIFTSIQEGAGAAMIRGSAISAFLNFVVVGQILAYGNKKKQLKKD